MIMYCLGIDGPVPFPGILLLPCLNLNPFVNTQRRVCRGERIVNQPFGVVSKSVQRKVKSTTREKSFTIQLAKQRHNLIHQLLSTSKFNLLQLIRQPKTL